MPMVAEKANLNIALAICGAFMRDGDFVLPPARLNPGEDAFLRPTPTR